MVVFVDLVIERRLDRRGQWTRSGTNAVRQGHNDEISALLVTRAWAVLAGDRAAFGHLLDARDPGFVSTEMRMFDNLQTFRSSVSATA